MSVYVEEYAAAVVHELTERDEQLANPGALTARAVASGPTSLSRSVSVVCRLCHGDLDQDLYCDLCGVVTLP
jgi:hypothetical protein